MLGLGATVLIIISIFLPMISVGGYGVGLFDTNDRQGATIAYIIIGLALAMGLFAFLANKKHLASIGTLIFALLLSLISLKWFNDATNLGASYGMGLILYLLASFAGIVASVLGFMKK